MKFNEDELYYIATHLDEASQYEINALARYVSSVARNLHIAPDDLNGLSDAYKKYYMYRQLLKTQKYEDESKKRESKAFKSSTTKKQFKNVGQMLRNFSLYLLGWGLRAQNHPKAIELEHKIQNIITKIIPTELDDKAIAFLMKWNDKAQNGLYELGKKLVNYSSDKEFNKESGRRTDEDEITKRKLFIQGYKQNPKYYEERGIKLNEEGFKRWKEFKEEEKQKQIPIQGEGEVP